MYFEVPTTAAQIGQFVGAKVVGDGETVVHSVASVDAAGKGSLTFFSDKRFLSALDGLDGAVLLTTEDFVRPELPLTYLVVEEPQLAFAKVATRFVAKSLQQGISPDASIHESAVLAQNVSVGPFAVIEEGVRVGSGTTIGPHACVGRKVEIGRDCYIGPHVTLMERVKVGHRVKIFPHSVVGSDGFGFLEGGVEVPQVGTVVIEDGVRIGALVTIDRAALGETRVGAGSKLDDHVHVAHNCQIGKNCYLCAFVGLSGSVTLEDNVMLGGQVGISNYVVVGKGARLGAQSGLGKNLKGGETYFGSPAIPLKDSLRLMKLTRKLPNFFERLKNLEGKGNGD